MKVLVAGATGMLGQALLAEAAARGLEAVGLARRSADFEVDVADDEALRRTLQQVRPQLIVNAVAVVSLDACERDPGHAYLVNARPAACFAEYCHESGARLLQVSTDHYYSGDGRARHDETAPLRLLNEYARTKYAGERFALSLADSLVLRTNIVGFRGTPGRPTLVEWAIDALRERKPLRLFTNMFHSPIAVRDFAAAAFDLQGCSAKGLINLSGRDVVSKAEFIRALAQGIGVDPDWAETGEVGELAVRRADSLGLDVGLAESLLQRPLPGLEATIARLVAELEST